METTAIFKNIKMYAEKRGLSISALEKAAGLSNATIDKWKISSPNATNLKAVADVLKVKVDTLLKE